jgi:hypothetical protein
MQPKPEASQQEMLSMNAKNTRDCCITASVLSEKVPKDSLDNDLVSIQGNIARANVQIEGLIKLEVDPFYAQIITAVCPRPEKVLLIGKFWEVQSNEFKQLKQIGVEGIALAFASAARSVNPKSFDKRVGDIKMALPGMKDESKIHLIAGVMHPYLPALKPKIEMFSEVVEKFKSLGINDDAMATILAAKFLPYASAFGIDKFEAETVVEHINIIKDELKVGTFDALMISIQPIYGNDSTIKGRYAGGRNSRIVQFTKRVYEDVSKTK